MSDIQVVELGDAFFYKHKIRVALGDDGVTYFQRAHVAKALGLTTNTLVARLNRLINNAGIALPLDDDLPPESWRKFLTKEQIGKYRQAVNHSDDKRQSDQVFLDWLDNTVFFEDALLDDCMGRVPDDKQAVIQDRDKTDVLPYARFDAEVGRDKTATCDFFSLSDDAPMRLIGIAGQTRSGKDTLASYLLSNLSDDWTRASFADPIKAMLSAIGVDCSDEAKAVVDEWGRHTIDSNMWVKAFARLNAGKCVIVPDVRFDNEADLIRKHGILIHLTGRGGIEGNHVSENTLEFKAGDIVLDNSRDLDWLYAQVDNNQALDRIVNEAGI